MTKRKIRRTLAPVEENLYYWWFQYLAASDEYIRCCQTRGRGPFNWVYRLLGDVRKTGFDAWWKKVGERFVIEPYTLRVVKTEGDAAETLAAERDDLLLMLNLWAPEAKLIDAFRKKLREHQTDEHRAASLEPIQTDFRLCKRQTAPVAERLKLDLRRWYEVQHCKVQREPQWTAFYKAQGKKPPRSAPPNRNTIEASVSRSCKSVQDALDGLMLGVFPAGPNPEPATLCPQESVAAYERIRGAMRTAR